MVVLTTHVNFSIPNTVQRKAAGILLVDFYDHFFELHSFKDLVTLFSSYYNHYLAFTGFVEWPPLQIFLLSIFYTFFGIQDSSPILFSLFLTAANLFLFVLLMKRDGSQKFVIVGTLILLMSHAYFIITSAEPYFEQGVIFFLLLCFLFLSKFLQYHSWKYLYFLAISLGFGLLYKLDVILIFIPLVVVFLFFFKEKLTFFSQARNYRHIFFCIVIILGIFSVYLGSQYVLGQYHLSPLWDRSFGLLDKGEAKISQPSLFLTVYEYEFQHDLSIAQKEIILDRIHFSNLQRFVIVLLSLFFQWFLFPFFLYLFPAAPFVIFLAIRSLKDMQLKFRYGIMIILIFMSVTQATFFINDINTGNHIISVQHDFDTTSQFIVTFLNVHNLTGSIITTKSHEMAYAFIKKDAERRVFMHYLPDLEEDFQSLLNTQCRNMSISYLEKRGVSSLGSELEKPPCMFIVIHEQFEENPILVDGKIYSYNATSIVQERTDYALVNIIPSTHLHSRTFIYQKKP
ncbi:glycosyltransferase family 39 protein [Candidatus Woesearchaeota archaeon]|nr:glycosyltransferase family 39 protein [Candidatus Woesearchaeota archaeon]